MWHCGSWGLRPAVRWGYAVHGCRYEPMINFRGEFQCVQFTLTGFCPIPFSAFQALFLANGFATISDGLHTIGYAVREKTPTGKEQS